MTELLHCARAVLRDLIATLLFLGIYGVTRNIPVAVAAGLLLALGQIGWEFSKGRRVDALQWIGLVVIASSGTATLISSNPFYVMLQPSLIYCLVGAAMLQRGWQTKYLPPRAIGSVDDLAVVFGYVWAGLMFFSAALNLLVAQHAGVAAWAGFMGVYATASKLALFALQFAMMKTIGKRRARARIALTV
jgi:intracellular septation protein A